MPRTKDLPELLTAFLIRRTVEDYHGVVPSAALVGAFDTWLGLRCATYPRIDPTPRLVAPLMREHGHDLITGVRLEGSHGPQRSVYRGLRLVDEPDDVPDFLDWLESDRCMVQDARIFTDFWGQDVAAGCAPAGARDDVAMASHLRMKHYSPHSDVISVLRDCRRDRDRQYIAGLLNRDSVR